MITLAIVLYGCKKCNLNCLYCNPHDVLEAADSTQFKLDKAKLATTIETYPKYQAELENGIQNPQITFEIWGGNPLLHKKEFRETVEFLEFQYPHCTINTTDNCFSLADNDTVEYIIQHNIGVQLSHDGYGQWLRSGNFDPLQDEKINSNIIKLVNLGLITAINCVLNRANCSPFKNIEYFNKWRWKNNIENQNLFIKLNHIMNEECHIDKINTFGNWQDKIDESRKGKEIGDLHFYGNELSQFISEYTQLGIYFRKNDFNNLSLYFKPFAEFVLDMTKNYRILTADDLEYGACSMFQRGYKSHNFAIDTTGDFCQCDLVESDVHVKNPKGNRPSYCKDCKFSDMTVCQCCGAYKFPKECNFNKAMAQMESMFYTIDTGKFLFSNVDFNLKNVLN